MPAVPLPAAAAVCLLFLLLCNRCLSRIALTSVNDDVIRYGVLLGESAIWAPNVPAAIMGAAYTAAFYANCPDNADWCVRASALNLTQLRF